MTASRWWQAFVLGLGPLVRPELLLLSVVFLGVVVGAQWRQEPGRRNVALLAAAFALPVAYEIFRMGYYGSLVPNSAIAKEASRSYWSFGLTYLRQTVVDSYALWIPLVILLVGAYMPLALYLRREHRNRTMLVVGAFLVGGLLLAVYIVRVGGDFMHARLLLPALFTLLAPVAVVPATKKFALAALVVPWAFVVIVALRFPGEKDPVLGTSNPNAITAVRDRRSRVRRQVPRSPACTSSTTGFREHRSTAIGPWPSTAWVQRATRWVRMRTCSTCSDSVIRSRRTSASTTGRSSPTKSRCRLPGSWRGCSSRGARSRSPTFPLRST